MKRLKRASLAVLAAAAVMLTATGCSQVSTDPDEVALHYSGGSLSSKKFKECVPVSSRQLDGPGDKHFTYPASQRNVVFDKGGDIDPITFVTKDGIEMTATGVLNFLLNTSCKPLKTPEKTYQGGALQQFHELIGNRYAAYNEAAADDPDAEKSTSTSSGWDNKVIPIYLGRPLDTAIDRAGQQYNYNALYSDPKTKALWEKSVIEQLPDLVDRQTDGDTSFFEAYSITLQKPEPPREIKDKLIERQTAIAQADTDKAKAQSQKEAALAQIATQRAEARKKQADISAYRLAGMSPEAAVRAYNEGRMIDKGLNPRQPTYLVNGTQPQ